MEKDDAEVAGPEAEIANTRTAKKMAGVQASATPPMKRIFAWVGLLLTVAIVISVVMAVRSERKRQEQGLLQAVPLSIRTDATVFFDVEAGVLEGCGAGVFQITQSTLAAIRSEGLGFFETARTGRDGGHYYRYEEWKATPAEAGAIVLRAVEAGCAELNDMLTQSVWRAASSEGAYYSYGDEYDIIVIPNLGWVVVSFLD